MAFETPTPAFKSPALDKMRAEVGAQPEKSEAERTTEHFATAADKLIGLELHDSEAVNFINNNETTYHSDGETELGISLKIDWQAEQVIIRGSFKGEQGKSKKFSIYKVNLSGEVFRADHDNMSEYYDETEWVKVSPNAVKDVNRIAEARQMLASAIGGVDEDVRMDASNKEVRKRSAERDLANIKVEQMGGEPEDFKKLADLLRDAVRFNGASAKDPVHAMAIAKERRVINAELKEYGIDPDDPEHVEQMNTAILATIEQYTEVERNCNNAKHGVEVAEKAKEDIGEVYDVLNPRKRSRR